MIRYKPPKKSIRQLRVHSLDSPVDFRFGPKTSFSALYYFTTQRATTCRFSQFRRVENVSARPSTGEFEFRHFTTQNRGSKCLVFQLSRRLDLVFRMPNFQFSTLDASLFFSARASLHKPLHKVPKSKRVGRMSSFRFRQLLFSKKTVSSPPSWRPRENSTGNFWYPRVPRFISFSVAAFVFSVATRRGETYIGVLVPYCLVF